VIFGSAYDGWGFASTYLSGGNLRAQEHPLPSPYASAAEKDKLYAGTVTSDLAMGAIGRARSPYFVQIAPYAPHSRVGPVGAFANEPVFPAAFGDRPSAARPMGNCGAVRCGALTVRDLRGFGDDQRNNQPRYRDGTLAPHWNPPPGGLGVRTALTFMRDRARMAQSADRMIQRVLNTVDLRRTYVVLTSDNGFHLGQNGMGAGKGSAYDTDIRVPLMVAGPGVRPGVRDGVVSNIDLAATVEDLMGVRTPAYRSGVSFAASLRNPKAATTDLRIRGAHLGSRGRRRPGPPDVGGGVRVASPAGARRWIRSRRTSQCAVATSSCCGSTSPASEPRAGRGASSSTSTTTSHATAASRRSTGSARSVIESGLRT
jgi:N-acetylglucosamine-6-sulfatase